MASAMSFLVIGEITLRAGIKPRLSITLGTRMTTL